MYVNYKRRELNLKIVYCGAAQSGKTTNLQYIHAHTKQALRSDLVTLKTQEDRTLFFDYMQLELGEIRGLKPRFSLYTVPGQARYAATRKLLLQGVDGLVLVADSQQARLTDNVVALVELEKHVRSMGQRLESLPLVVQCNKQDLPGALAPAVLTQYLGYTGVPCLSSAAVQGRGVSDTLKVIIHQVLQAIV